CRIKLSDEGQKKDWKSIRVKANTKDKLEDMGVGISKAVEMLVEMRQKAVTDKIEDIGEITGDIANILFESGLFDIKFRGSGLDNVSIEGDCVIIHGFIKVGIADEGARQEIYEAIKDGLKE
ncbi:unnamed protein product, partial [marine sediment metagenome]